MTLIPYESDILTEPTIIGIYESNPGLGTFDIYRIRPDTGSLTIIGSITGLISYQPGQGACRTQWAQQGDSLFLTNLVFDGTYRVFGNGLSFAAVQFYSEITGTVEFSTGSTTVTGTNTRFTEEITLPSPAQIYVNGVVYDIASVTDDVTLDLTAAYTDISFTGVSAAVPIEDDASYINNEALAPGLAFVPGAVAFYQNRLVLGASLFHGRQHIWMSALYDPFVIKAAPQLVISDAQPLDFDLSGAEDTIYWMLGGDTLFIGGQVKEYTLIDRSFVGPNSPPNFITAGTRGSNEFTPVTQLDGRVIFIPDKSPEVILFEFRELEQRFAPIDIASLARHLTQGVTSITQRGKINEDPIRRVFFVKDSEMVIASEVVEDQLPAFSRFSYATSGLSITDIVTSDKRVFVWASRDSDNFVSLLEIVPDTDGYVVDLRTTATPTGGIPTTTWSVNEPSLYNKSIIAIVTQAGGDPYSAQFVDVDNGGNFILQQEASAVFVGIPVVGVIEPHFAVTGDQLGASINRPHRTLSITVGVRNTKQFLINEETQTPELLLPLGVERADRTSSFKHYLLGWAYDHIITISSLPPYDATILTVTKEQAV